MWLGLLFLACAPRPEAAPAPAASASEASGGGEAGEAGEADSPDLLAGCHALGPEPGEAHTPTVRRLRCRTLVAVVEDLAPDGLSDEVALPLLLTRELPGPASAEPRPDTILLGGAPAEVLRFDDAGADGLSGFLAGRELPDGSLRRVLVAGPGADPGGAIASASLLEALLLATELDLPEAPAGPDFLGRPLDLPPGCEPLLSAPGTTEIACPTGWTRWATGPELLDAEAGLHLEAVLAQHLERASEGEWAREVRGCRVDGVSARCLLLSAPEGGGMLQATAAWRGVGLMVQCTVTAGEQLAPVCAGLVDLDPP